MSEPGVRGSGGVTVGERGRVSGRVGDEYDDVLDHAAAEETGEEGADEVGPGRGEPETAARVPDEDVAGALEAILLVVDSPVGDDALAAAVGHDADSVRAHLTAIADRLTAARSGIDLRQTGSGWRFYTRDAYAPVVERFVMDGTQTRLSRAALETLAVVAYRQPVTRSRIAAVRGVNVDGVVRTLLSRGLVEEQGTEAETGAILYRTTEMFLERMGLTSIEDLPALGPLLPDVDAIDDE